MYTEFSIMIIKLIVTLIFARCVFANEKLWAIQLVSDDEQVANEVAEELGMVVIEKIFHDVFLFRWKDYEGPYREPQHPLIIWSEQQAGHRRSSRHEKLQELENKPELQKVRIKNNRHRRILASERSSRNVGGLEQKPMRSPWSYQRSRDPLRWRQWYLGSGSGMHLNVTSLWAQGIRGGGISVAILDDGVESTHLDLALNYDPAASWDLLDADPDPMPMSWSRHGTQLAGIIAATHFNGMCGMGVAPWSGVGAVRMLGYVAYDAVEAAALSYERDHVDVYVAAWGPVDTGAVMEGPGILASRAIRESIALGRNGLGSIYVWASGNGGFVGDDCNADGYANSVYTLTVSGSTKRGRSPNYAESCAATFVSTYSGDSDEEFGSDNKVNGIVTTDLGGVCTDSFRGSSVSAAMVAGACALALDVNPELGWRDMQHLMIQAAMPYNPLPSQWKINGVGRMYSHYFGYGSLNAGKMVDIARKWQRVPPAFQCRAHSPHINITLTPDMQIIIPISISGCQIVKVEHVQANISLSADNRGQIEIILESPLGTTSKLLPQRPLDLSPYGIQNHPMLSVHMWGEDPRGIWKLYVTYHSSNILAAFGEKRYVTTPNLLHSCSLIVHGTEVSLDQATVYNYHYTKAQLIQVLHASNGTEHLRNSHQTENLETTPETDTTEFTIEVEHWISNSNITNDTLLHLFCRVMTQLPNQVINIEWENVHNESFNDIIRQLRGNGPRARKYPSLLIIRKTENITGQFYCKVTLRDNVLIRKLRIDSNYSSIPQILETAKVAVEGEDVTLTCEGLSPILRGTWIKDDDPLNQTSRMIMNEDNLIINNVTSADEGLYECYKRAPRLHYSHKASISLLLAKGPSTLTKFYAIDSHPPLPTNTPKKDCSSKQDESEQDKDDTSSFNFTVDTLRIPQRQCPPPYRPIEGHCVLIGAGPARPWHQARQQCQNRKGDLLVIHDPSLMLALIQMLHTQGLASRSFWVGGLREDTASWRWVDGTPMPMAAPFWFSTPSHQPQRVPIIQRNNERSLHEDYFYRREVYGPHRGGFMTASQPQTSLTNPSLLQRLGMLESGSSTRRRQLRRSRRKIPPHIRKRKSTALRSRHPASGSRKATPRQPENNPNDYGGQRRLISSDSRDQNISQSTSPVTLRSPSDSRTLRDSQQVSESSENIIPSESIRRRPTVHTHSKKAGSIDTLTRNVKNKHRNRGRLRSSQPRVEFVQRAQTRSERPSVSESDHHPRDIKGQRAVCMWAGLRHFFGSCSVLERLSSICEYKEEAQI